MQLRRRKTAAAIAVAVIAGALGGAPGALAAPPGPNTSASADDREGTDALPPVWPRPQSMRAGGSAVPLTARAVLVTPRATDPHALKALRDLLRESGVREITEIAEGTPLPAGNAVVVRAAREQGRGSPTDSALRSLGASARGDLPSGGYRIAAGQVTGRDTVALDGVGADGLFHAVQTLRQLVTDGSVPGVVVRDWPGTAVRGMTEGFYGTPWTARQRLAQLDFMGRTKQNRYLYAPGDDLYRQARWREAYPAQQRAEFRDLAERARANHVTLGWAVAPGQAMCLSSPEDTKALNRKVDAMWALGVRAFQLQFQDVSYSEWHCSQDAEKFGSGPEAAARAQAQVANALSRHLKDRHPEAGPLSLMPTEYYQDGATDYRDELARELDDRVEVAWTGVGVVPRTITGRELAGAREALDHPLVTMDNYPVNDFAQDRIFLGPYTGREPAVATGSAGLLANAMEQPAASRIPLFTAADYAWNPKDYRPQESWRAAIDDLAGDNDRTREALGALAGNDASSVLGADESAYLRPLMKDFWQARTAAARAAIDDGDRDSDAERAAQKQVAALRDAFTVMREAPQRLSADAPDGLDKEVRPWSTQLARYGEAGEQAVDLLMAQARGDGAAAWRAQVALDGLREDLADRRVTVGKGVLDPFLKRATDEASAWSGTDRARGEVDRDAETYTVRLPRPRPLTAVTAMAGPEASGTVEAHVPGQGWRRLGALAKDGWTETDGKDVRADAIRVTGGSVEQVAHLVPWYTDTPAAGLRLPRAETEAEIGGQARKVTARLTAQRPGSVSGRLKAKAPKGIEVTTPKRSTLPRGAEVDVDVEVKVASDTPAGSYEVPVTFGGESSTLTVRASPKISGPDLVREGKASSSGDETDDFPASAAADGDQDSRWSSPAQDGAWWQTELAEPVRLGRVKLHWQDAYASAYRVQVSRDGRSWRTAATVKDGRGGRETVGMDARDVSFIRVQGDRRATRFGLSLFSVEAYAVAQDDTKK